MAEMLACLRMDLDFMPSPVPDRPGLLIRDPHRYSEATLIIPPPLVDCLRCFDGRTSVDGLRACLARIADADDVPYIERHLSETLHDSGFLMDEIYARLRDSRHREFAAAPVREPSHAGAAYPDDPDPLRETLDRYMNLVAQPATSDGIIGIAAPHVSLDGGGRMYGAAYRALAPVHHGRTFVILGTSHYGVPDRFGLTRKPFRTPYGDAQTDSDLVDRLAAAAPDSITMEDYCHATEHSIEFQVLFLQHVFGPEIRILPILCGSFARSLQGGGMPEDSAEVEHFLGALRELAHAEAGRLFWVLGVDMAHMGRRYGDQFAASANMGEMTTVASRDKGRIDRVVNGDARGFWNLIREQSDDLKWCGSSAFYTLMRAVPSVKSRLLGYDQWNIDPESVVTFGALAFYDPATSP